MQKKKKKGMGKTVYITEGKKNRIVLILGSRNRID